MPFNIGKARSEQLLKAKAAVPAKEAHPAPRRDISGASRKSSVSNKQHSEFSDSRVRISEASRKSRFSSKQGLGVTNEQRTLDAASKKSSVSSKQGSSNKPEVQVSSKSALWSTPSEILQGVLDVLGTIDLDPCCKDLKRPNAPASSYYTIQDDGLSKPWVGKVFMNPPYGDAIEPWPQKLTKEYRSGNTTEAIALLPARTDTFWMGHLNKYPRCYVRGRLKFLDIENSSGRNSAPFPSVLVYLGANADRFFQVFRHWGDCYVLAASNKTENGTLLTAKPAFPAKSANPPGLPVNGIGPDREEGTLTLEELGVELVYCQDADSIATALVEVATHADLVGIDIETASKPEFRSSPKAGLDPHKSDIRLVQLYNGNGRVFVLDGCCAELVDLIAASNVHSLPWIAHNAVFEMKFLVHAGLHVQRIGCTMLQANALDGTLPGLRELVERRLGYRLNKSHQASDWSCETLSAEQLEYAALDAVVTHRLAVIQARHLRETGLEGTYERMVKAQPSIVQLELNGCPFDGEAHSRLVARLKDEAETRTEELVGIIGTGVNPGSAKQMGAWLKENMNAASLASWPRTAKGALATNASAWKAQPDFPVSAAMLSYKRARTRLNSFGEKYRQHIHSVTGRIHASFRLGGIVSGRIACSKPNLQQVPREPEFRALFTPGDGMVLVVADYSQIELRVAALLSKDASMLQAYRDGIDIHRATAAAMLDIQPEEVTSTQRTQAKALTFGTLYASASSITSAAPA